ncbi:MAG: hypothetical protein K2X27_08645 [Candidatus Obscuribacterales bacterium]|nr:hypothetical protein [Candidatus Obscuribacterales bacterium]
MSDGMNKQSTEFGDLLSMVMAMVQERIGIIIGGTLFFSIAPALCLIPAGISIFALGALNADNFDFLKLIPIMGTVGVCTLAFLASYFALRLGWVAICLKITKAQAAPFSEFFSNFDKLANFLILQFLLTLIISAGMVCLVVPAIFLGIRFCFAPLLVVDQNMGPIDALKTSWTMVEGSGMKIFLAGLAYFVINMIVGMIPLLGIFAQVLAIAFFDLLITSLYRATKGDLIPPG